eukprot:TRINITY_DN44712_c0_g1_i1.p1 TRINITY_DN44712_c0_g1~~TRINITY_DN44712_c0_g1_i1.p1  ORF type:complete len:545 (-),score=129.91 TRINITY_DN44712_c0_g1_i1:68-1702(-)
MAAMEDELLAFWAKLPPEERHSLLQIHDPECVRLIDYNMRMLWTAEIQARQFGVRGPTDPFDQAQLPLLATMQFDGSSGVDGEEVMKLVKWPQEFTSDPTMMVNAIRYAFQSSDHGTRQRSGAMKSQRWHQLFIPLPTSWAGFEFQLAQLLEQLVIKARDGGSQAPQTREADEELMGDHVWEEEAEESVMSPEKTIGARAAKRLRQRERRKLGKALARGEAVDELAAAAGVVAPAPRKEALQQPRKSASAAPAFLTAGADEQDEEEAAQAFTSLGQTASESPKEEGLAFEHRSSKQQKEDDACIDEEDEGEQDYMPGLFTQAARGFGRGRPMGGQQHDPFPGMHGRGVGRGRALAPPPGLQGLQLGSNQRLPGSLSRPWMPGPPIPEDEDIITPILAPWTDIQANLDLASWSLPPAAVPSNRRSWADADGSSSEASVDQKARDHASSYLSASYVATPLQKWSKTPSPPSTPMVGLPGQFGSAGFDVEETAVHGDAADPMSVLPNYSMVQPPIPLYVTVPIAMAHNCPHCGKQFAMLPEGQDAPV